MESLPGPLMKLGQATLTKVADKFVDFVIIKYTGKSIKVFEAEGDVEADKVKSKWEHLEKPYWLQAEAIKMNRQYSNFGNTLQKAAPLISSSRNKILEDNDFFWGLLEHSKEISNEQIQGLIAKIIAGEYNKPGTYSMNTLQILKMLGKKELELFEVFCSLLIGDQIPDKLFSLGLENRVFMDDLEIDFSSLQSLQSLGLFLPNSMTRGMKNLSKKNVEIEYFEHKLVYESIDENYKEVRLPGFYGISIVGEQIKQHLTPNYNDKYFEWLKANYKIPHYKLILEKPKFSR